MEADYAFGDGLIEGKINFIGCVNAPIFFVDCCRECDFRTISAFYRLGGGGELRHYLSISSWKFDR